MKYVKCFESFIAVFKQAKVKVAIYYDYGVGQNTVAVWSNFFRSFFETEPTTLSSDRFAYESIKDFDLIVIPGGKGYKENLSMSDEDKEGLKKYVSEGGRVLGVCAGAFFMSSCYDWSLDLVPIGHTVSENDHLTTDILTINFKITPKGKEVFSTSLDNVDLYFHGGPVLFDNSNNYEVLLKFNEEVPHDRETSDFSKGKVAAAAANYGKGHAIIVSPHFEKTEEHQHLLANCINYLLKK